MIRRRGDRVVPHTGPSPQRHQTTFRTAALAATLSLLVACSALTDEPEVASPSPATPTSSSTPRPSGTTSQAPTPPGQAPASPQATTRIERLLGRVAQTERSPYHPGYDRTCTGTGACQFGEEWTDNHPGRFGQNGCTTREDVLLQQMKNIEMRWGSTCRIYEAALVDPYTGARLTWRDDGYWIQIDHIYPLAEAWHAGAWQWPQRKRVRFANDVSRELLAVSGRANYEKGSQTPSEWLPPNRRFRCEYVARYLAVAAAYDLTVTAADATTIRRVARRCR